jgi:hypothetical protein
MPLSTSLHLRTRNCTPVPPCGQAARSPRYLARHWPGECPGALTAPRRLCRLCRLCRLRPGRPRPHILPWALDPFRHQGVFGSQHGSLPRAASHPVHRGFGLWGLAPDREVGPRSASLGRHGTPGEMIKRRPEVMRRITHDEGDAVRDCGHVFDPVVLPPCQWSARYLNLAGVGAPSPLERVSCGRLGRMRFDRPRCGRLGKSLGRGVDSTRRRSW